jgi:hypothetical protein
MICVPKQVGCVDVSGAVHRPADPAVPQGRFPTDEVYYPTLTPTLRLVTCGGDFNAPAGHYRSNVIVFATMQR